MTIKKIFKNKFIRGNMDQRNAITSLIPLLPTQKQPPETAIV